MKLNRWSSPWPSFFDYFEHLFRSLGCFDLTDQALLSLFMKSVVCAGVITPHKTLSIFWYLSSFSRTTLFKKMLSSFFFKRDF